MARSTGSLELASSADVCTIGWPSNNGGSDVISSSRSTYRLVPAIDSAVFCATATAALHGSLPLQTTREMCSSSGGRSALPPSTNRPCVGWSDSQTAILPREEWTWMSGRGLKPVRSQRGTAQLRYWQRLVSVAAPHSEHSTSGRRTKTVDQPHTVIWSTSLPGAPRAALSVMTKGRPVRRFGTVTSRTE
eukprot:1701883-Rhodomonas_salina.1